MTAFFKKLMRRTLARDLILSLLTTLIVGFASAGAINYWYSLDKDTTALKHRADEVMTNIARVLAPHVWSLDDTEIVRTMNIFNRSEDVNSILVWDEHDNVIAETTLGRFRPIFSLERDIVFEGKFIGKVKVFFSDYKIVEKQVEVARYSLIVFLLISSTTCVVTLLLLRLVLNKPLEKLIEGVGRISAGDYTHELPSVKQLDVSEVSQRINQMAKEIFKREKALTQNRENLEQLNQAILDLFSCSDTESLIRKSLEVVGSLCEPSMGWFRVSEKSFAGGQVGGIAPVSTAYVKGSYFKVEDDSELLQKEQQVSDKILIYDVRSHHRSLGNMAFLFELAPANEVRSFLDMIMSLVNHAMSRQSYIRESAFNAAELQVAETVQRSMLPEDKHVVDGHTEIAYYYEPVLRVGGDWFYFLESPDKERLIIVIGDVTGHGLAQGLVTTAVVGAMNVIQQLVKTDYEGFGLQPSQIIQTLNEVIEKISGRSHLHMTCVAAMFDYRREKLIVCNAGHSFPLVLKRQGDSTMIRNLRPLSRYQNPILGSRNDSAGDGLKFLDAEYELDFNSVFLFYTDGLLEASNVQKQRFQRPFIRQLAKLDADENVASIKDQVIQGLREHMGEQGFQDDVCLITVKPKRHKSALKVS